MAEVQAFEAFKREITGTGPARELRRNGRVPAVVYGAGKEPIHVSLPLKEITFSSNRKNFKSTVFELTLDGKKIKVIPKDISFHPVTDAPEHVDLQFVSEKTSVKAFVPVVYVNQVKSPGLKKGGVLNIVSREIEFYVNPSNIPAQIEVDLSGMEIGHARHINDLKLPDGAKPVNKTNFTLATVVGKGSEEETTTVAATDAAAVPGAPAAAGAPAAPGAAPAAAAPAAGAAAAKPAAKK